jgi:MFS family permease
MSVVEMFTLNAYWAGISFMWNALHPIVLPALILDFVADNRKNTYLGLLTFAGLVIAMAVQPIAGSISDRWSSRFGRRRPLMAFSTALACAFLGLIAWAGGLAWVFIGYIGLQVSANCAQGPLQGLLRDRVPANQLARASSIKVFLDVASLSLAALVAGRLMGSTNGNSMLILLIMIVLLLLCAAITIGFTPETPTDREVRPVEPVPTATAAPRLQGAYWRLILERGIFLFGVYGVQAFGLYFLRDALHEVQAATKAGYLLGAVGAATIVLVLIGGWLADRLGPKTILYVASGLTAIGMVLIAVSGDYRGLVGAAVIVGAGIGLFLTSNWALANHLAPEAQAGKFMGLTNLATAGSAALARLQGPAVDYLNSMQPGAWLGYRGIFVLGAVCILGSILILRRIK